MKPGLFTLGAETLKAFSHLDVAAWMVFLTLTVLTVLINRWRRRKFHVIRNDHM